MVPGIGYPSASTLTTETTAPGGYQGTIQDKIGPNYYRIGKNEKTIARIRLTDFTMIYRMINIVSPEKVNSSMATDWWSK